MPPSKSLKRDSDDPCTTPANPKKPKLNGTITSFFGAPKAKATDGCTLTECKDGTGLGGLKFNKEKWVAGLAADQKELLALEIETLEESWLAHLKDELVSKEFLNLKRFLRKEIDSGAQIFPPLNEVYSWSQHTPLNKVKAVILGQDPYHGYGQAHGLCFSVRPPTPAPPSLQNIYIALKKDYPSFQPPPNKGGLLTPWADRGVLMLNACLTVRAGSPNSHSKHGWERFTQKAIDLVAKVRTRGVVFLAWGSSAAKRVAHIDRAKHCVLQSVHPSPLSAHNGFKKNSTNTWDIKFTCGHFKKANQWLENRYGVEGIIDWSLTKPVHKGIKSSCDEDGVKQD
ncbi:uracil DNA glycosylase [Emydomyces testavorans]|uniref:Uracil-DNA glycosylase n=1 Tax=Emydomyces testavorans TaxID=2070801 RepID=A0AAF0IGG5_9EURO|nr:uracil DNA glycosylase [Emydomyces testavorans]